MLAMHLTQFGEPEQSLKVVDIPEPQAAAPGQALIRPRGTTEQRLALSD
ncbi:hypothetical protein ACFZDJ_36655 [Streptomyces sp. NPDC007896]